MATPAKTTRPRKKTPPGRSRAKGSPAPPADETLDKLARALEMRANGHTYQDIVDAGIYTDPGNACHAVTKYLRDRANEAVDDLRAIQHMRYEALFRELREDRNMAASLTTRMAITDRLLTLMRDYNKLQGLNAPTKIEITDEMDREIQALAAELGADGVFGITDVGP